MADSKVSALSEKTTLVGTEEFHIADSGASRKAGVDTIATYVALAKFNATDLSAISDTIADTAVDLFVYDTSKDTDGGAWRERCQDTSWYNETLNTATRGATRKFPAVALILAENNQVTIYDATDTSLPMWMVFNVGGSAQTTSNIIGAVVNITSVAALNGDIVVGFDATSGTYNIIKLSFVSEKTFCSRPNAAASVEYNGTFSERNDGLGWTATGSVLIASPGVNDVAITVLKDAPIDVATGLPVPTFACATDGGVSVINNDKTVADSSETVAVAFVEFGDDDRLFYNDDSSDQVYYADTYASDGFSDGHYDADAAPYTLPGNVTALTLNTSGHADGVTILKEDQGTQSNGMVAYTTSDYTTGYMHGDIKGAFLADTDDTDLVGGTDNDRSVNGNDLTVNGTITRTAVGTGNELVAYSGFSAANYLEQPYNSDLDFGTGDFYVMGWVKAGSVTAQNILLEKDTTGRAGTARLTTEITAAGDFRLTAGAAGYVESSTLAAGAWVFVAGVCRSTAGEIYVNGNSDTAVTSGSFSSVTNASSVLTVGVGSDASTGAASEIDGLALWRIGAGAPSANQIKEIYEAEKHLFDEGAACTLYGSSDAVTALDYDSDTDLLHVGTSAGRSVFQGLRRVDNTTDAVGAAISAQGSFVADD
jgi:hypothetical protein